MVSLAKTSESIAAGRVQALQNEGLRKNDLIALRWEFAAPGNAYGYAKSLTETDGAV
ncbi:hypothetical protein [Streptomyces sp. H34-S4]|uniref:hypothetical protein n=1 Tax=Streptomyces sp. H34-S4 TaxID=2996463 RepID=UPI0022721CA3|nr:hypothetical protein [Streptomyces sp. H34-S4]MCY0933647.1 hypothetical protein [Streptomyces sp. H34-S4]